MKLLMAILGSLVLLAVAAFCLFGFLGTFEPTSYALEIRIGYSVVGLGCLVGVGFLMANAVRRWR